MGDDITVGGQYFTGVEQAFKGSVDDYLAFCAERGETPDRTFSGKVPLRLDPDLHRRAAARAPRPLRGACGRGPIFVEAAWGSAAAVSGGHGPLDCGGHGGGPLASRLSSVLCR